MIPVGIRLQVLVGMKWGHLRGMMVKEKNITLEVQWKEDRKIREKDPQGGIAHYLYDRNDLLIKESSPYGYGMDGGKGPGITYRYDSRGNQQPGGSGKGKTL